MAAKKPGKAAEGAACAPEAAAARPDEAAVTAVACALLQSPRFAARVMEERHQEMLVAAAMAIAAKLKQAVAR